MNQITLVPQRYKNRKRVSSRKRKKNSTPMSSLSIIQLHNNGLISLIDQLIAMETELTKQKSQNLILNE